MENKTLIDKEMNRNYIRNKKPSEYPAKIVSEQRLTDADLAKRLGAHIIRRQGLSR